MLKSYQLCYDVCPRQDVEKKCIRGGRLNNQKVLCALSLGLKVLIVSFCRSINYDSIPSMQSKDKKRIKRLRQML